MRIFINMAGIVCISEDGYEDSIKTQSMVSLEVSL